MNDVIRPSDLGGADLSKTDFMKSNLRDAILHRTHPAGADFYGARLVGADVSGARLIGANFSGPASPVPSQVEKLQQF